VTRNDNIRDVKEPYVRRFAVAAFALGVAAAALTMPARAQVTQTDMLVAGRTIGFIQNLGPGDVHVGIVYDPGVAQSVQQAAEISALMGDGLRIGSLTLRPVKLPIEKLDAGGVALFFLTEGLSANAAKISRTDHERKIPCITFDLSQVRNGTCAIGVRSQPRIEVIVNGAAAKASGTVLSAVFRMMITEI
jgi:ABC-type uncharacterized transport system substrate-binding protein